MRAWLVLVSSALLLSACGQPEVAGLVATPPPTAEPLPTVSTHNPGVADMLRQRPAPGVSVELDAYFSGAGTGMSVPGMGGPPPQPGQVACPQIWNLLTDQPYQASLLVLNATSGVVPSSDAAWLLATTPEAIAPGKIIGPNLPYHARLRGRFGDPAFAACPQADRIFVVEQVITVYPEQPVVSEFALPVDYAAWPRYRDALQGYSIPYPPGWQAQRLDDMTVQIQNLQQPTNNVVVRVEAGPVPDTTALMRGARSVAMFEQGGSFGASFADSQRLGGREVWRSVAGGRNEISVIFGGVGKTYELSVRYGSGFDLPQSLLTLYTAMVEGFRLDAPPPPFPTEAPPLTAAPVATATPLPTVTPAPPGFPTMMPVQTPSPAPFPGDFKLTLDAVQAQGAAPLSVTLRATLTGGTDNSYELYCSGWTWEFGDGQMMMTTPDCGPWSSDIQIQRTFTTEYTYKQPGTYQARLKIGGRAGTLESNVVTIEVP